MRRKNELIDHSITITFRDNKKLNIEVNQIYIDTFKRQIEDDNKLFVEIGNYQFNKAEIKIVSYD